MTFGEKVANRRRELGLNQKELAEAIDVSYDTPSCLYIFTGVMPGGTPYEVQVSSRDKGTFEVIGNRWDNPELVEV